MSTSAPGWTWHTDVTPTPSEHEQSRNSPRRARPRHTALTGVQSLTASERRVAELAATGASNPDIAQQLFVTRKTVETHLGHVYRKLGIDSRHHLRTALTDEQD